MFEFAFICSFMRKKVLKCMIYSSFFRQQLKDILAQLGDALGKDKMLVYNLTVRKGNTWYNRFFRRHNLVNIEAKNESNVFHKYQDKMLEQFYGEVHEYAKVREANLELNKKFISLVAPYMKASHVGHERNKNCPWRQVEQDLGLPGKACFILSLPSLKKVGFKKLGTIATEGVDLMS